MKFRLTALCAAFLWASTLFVQTSTFTLDDALRMARHRNGSVQAAFLNLQAARADVKQAAGSFLPTLTPVFRYDSSRTNFQTGGQGTGAGNSAGDSFDITAGWRLFDSGERLATLASNRSNAQASEQNAIDTVRQTLFLVHSRFYNALRAQELLKVNQAQETRAAEILKQTEIRVQTGDAAKKDILQARADLLNARVSVLQAQSRTSTSISDLKAVIGWDTQEPLPPLDESVATIPPAITDTLNQIVDRALNERADLRSDRKRIESNRASLRLTELQAGITWNLDVQFRKSFAPGVSDRSALAFEATMPLFDGFRSRERVRSQRFSLQAQMANYEQSELNARAEIESAYVEYQVNRERLVASQGALEAARENYNAAIESQRLGAGNVIEVLTAQLSLVTAESNFVEARYDLMISEIRLRLASGETLPGEF